MLSLADALRYPLQTKGWARPIFLLTLCQLIPVIGQWLLIGYGMAVVRAIYAGETDLPAMQWGKMVWNGFLFLVIGVIYLVPLAGLLPQILLLDTFLGDSSWLTGLVTVLFIFLLSVIGVGLHVGGVRHALGFPLLKGLLGGKMNIQILLQKRQEAGLLIQALLGLCLLAIPLLFLGTVLLVLPALFVVVWLTIAVWYLLAQFGLLVKIAEADDWLEDNGEKRSLRRLFAHMKQQWGKL